MRPLHLLPALLAASTLAACTSSGGGPAPTTPPGSTTGTAAPVAAVTARAASSCPLLTATTVSDTLGFRLGRITVLRRGATFAGCRFYASQGAYHASEHLPGPSQPALEVVITPHPTSADAHNAFVLAQRAGTDASTVQVTRGVAGVTYRTRFDPADGTRDWACGWSTGTRSVLLRVAEDDSAQEAADLAGRVQRAL